MAEFDNPVTSAIFLRFLGPLVPVWLVGATLVLVLDRFSVGGSTLTTRDLGLLLGLYSVLVAALVSLLYYREWRHSPGRVELTVDGIRGRLGRVERSFAYGSVLRVQPAGYFNARVEARASPTGPVDWLNLTEENARRLTEAWGAWRERARGSA